MAETHFVDLQNVSILISSAVCANVIKPNVKSKFAKIRKKFAKKRIILHTYIKYIDENEDFDLKDTRGIKKYCIFNDLKYFHILDNFSVDIMHDINEGVIPYFLRTLYKHFVSVKLLKLCQVQAKYEILAMVF